MKRTYENPTTKVIILQEREYLLTGSDGLSGEISGYGKAGSGFSQDETQKSRGIWDND